MDDELKNLLMDDPDLRVQKFRVAVVNTSNTNEDIQQVLFLDGDNEDNIGQWQRDMASDRFWVDHAFIQLCADYIKRDIMILPFYVEDGHNGTGWIKVPAKESAGKIHLLCYMNIHYQSIQQISKDNFLVKSFGQVIQAASKDSPRKRPRRQ